MTPNGAFQILLFFLLVLLVTKPLGAYMAKVFAGQRTLLSPLLRPVERLCYRLFGIDPEQDMRWTTYAFAMLTFSVVGALLTYGLLRFQGHLPLNPQKFGGKEMTPDLAFNTAVSFTTNTNWQSYVPEGTVSYFSNMVALAIHNWMSAAAGIAVAIALVRGFARRQDAQTADSTTLEGTASRTLSNSAPTGEQRSGLAERRSAGPGIGNFWADITRATLYVLLPLSLVYALFLVQQGVPQNFAPYTTVKTVEGAAQTLAQGPVASQEAIKMLGTNGGGFFNANSAHPYENPTPLSNLIQMLSIFAIPAALTYTFGRMVGNTKQGWALFGAMSALFFTGVCVCTIAEQKGNPTVAAQGVAVAPSSGQPGGNMEGKETRFGITNSALFATVTTDASCGAVNAMHDSFTPLGGLIPVLNIMFGECVFGGVGAGLYGMLMYAVLAVFIAGLMVGRTPEYLGKKIEQFEVKMAMLAVLVLAADILLFTAVGSNLNLPTTPTASSAALNHVNNSSPDNYVGPMYANVNNSGAHGLSEITYAYTSAAGNNGSAFAGLTANTPIWNVTLGFGMLVGRFLMIIPLLAIAGSMARKKFVPATSGTFPTDSATFAVLLVGIVIIVGALTFFPTLSLGPIVEHFQMSGGKTF